MKIKAAGKAVIILGIVAAIGFGLDRSGYLNQKIEATSSVPKSADLKIEPNQATVSTHVNSVVSNITPSDKKPIKLLEMAWNAQTGINFANGGPKTMLNSLMDKHGINLTIERQDDYAQMATQQVAFAKNENEGATFVIIMGDGYPAYIASLNEVLSKFGQSAEVIGAVGYSRGEDKCMLPYAVKTDPKLAKGKVVAAVLRDGDWNICVKWAADNDIAINPSETTYDPNALNFSAVNDYVSAGKKYLANMYEDRDEIINGVLTGKKVRVKIDGVATWTPVDVTIAKEKGGLDTIASTKEYRWQMPAVIIGNKQWNAKNRNLVNNFLIAALTGGELIKDNDSNLTIGANINAKIYNEETGDFWKKYFIGVKEKDKMGHVIELGGSSTMGLGDNAFLFGLNGNDNLYKMVYTVYGGLVTKYYPEILSTLLPYDNVVNTSYLQDILGKTTVVSDIDKPTYNPNMPNIGSFAKRSINVEFQSGKVTLTGKANEQLSDLANQLAVSGNAIKINGHTDNVGDSDMNYKLSKDRATVVKNWLVAHAGSAIPSARITTEGFGDTRPVGSNATNEGKAKNRRVEIILVAQ